jgi:hypothetical protein
VSGINVDNEKPTITDVNVANEVYMLGAVPTAASCTATDGYSGPQSCKVAVTGETNGVGTFDWTATATDKAGNTDTQGRHLQGDLPVRRVPAADHTAHQTGLTTSAFKAGSTFPVKLQLRNAAGTAVQSATAPVWLIQRSPRRRQGGGGGDARARAGCGADRRARSARHQRMVEVVGQGIRPPRFGRPSRNLAVLKWCLVELAQIELHLPAGNDWYSATQTALS